MFVALRNTILTLMGGLLLLLGTLPASAQSGRVHALCIGINKYRAAGIRQLSFAERGAEAVAEVLSSRYGYAVETLLGEQATRSAVFARLTDLGARLGDGDAVILYFAGQTGTLDVNPETLERRAFMFLQDTTLTREDRDRARWGRQALEIDDLLAPLARARHVVILGETTCGGRFGELPTTFAPAATDHAERVLRRSRMLLTAGHDGQRTIESSALQSGLFTHALLQALATDQPQTSTELFLNLRVNVLRDSEQALFPLRWSWPDADGEFVFVPRAAGDPGAATRAAGARLAARGVPAGNMTLFYQALEEISFKRALNAAAKEQAWRERSAMLFEAASLGDPLAMSSLVFCFNKGLGVPVDDVQAFRWATLAHDTGHPAGQHVLGRCYNNGFGAPRDARLAARLFRDSAETGFPASIYLIALDALRGGAFGARQRDALAQLEKIKDSGLTNAALLLAQCYTGRVRGIPRNVPEALRLLRAAAERGNAEAEFTLYQLLTESRPDSPPRDEETARRLLRSAAESGVRSAQFCLAAAYFQGPNYEQYRIGLPVDYQQARRWAELADEGGSPEASVLLSVMYATGAGVPIDLVKAKAMNEKGIAAKYAGAFVQRGIYHLGGGVYPPDDTRAFEYFRKAAEAGDAAGAFWLAFCYDEVRGIEGIVVPDALTRQRVRPRFALQAIQWYVRSAQRGYPAAIEALRTRTWPPETLEQLASIYPETHKEYRRLSGR